MTYSTNYRDTLITVSTDCPVDHGTVPVKPGTIATLQHQLLGDPHRLTSDDLLFEVHAIRNAVPEGERDAARAALLARPQACLRASPLVKQFGWGLHHDDEGHVAAVAMESDDYARLLADPAVAKVPGMRSKRA